MNNQLYWDIETSHKVPGVSSILSASFQLVNDNFQKLDSLDLECNLKPGVVPAPKALLVNGQSIKKIQGRNKSHFQLVKEIYDKFKYWGQFDSCTFNGVFFDEQWIRHAFYSSLLPIYVTNTNGNKILDVLNLVRGTSVFDPGKIIYGTSDKGKPSFKLEDLSKLNGLTNDGFHDASVDVESTIKLAKLIKEKCPIVWKSYMMSIDKKVAEELIKKEKLICTFESYYGGVHPKCVTYVSSHKHYQNYYLAFDLVNDPEIILNTLNNYSSFKSEVNATPKKFRTLKANKSILLMNYDFSQKDKNSVYSKLGLPTLLKRAEMILNNREKIAEKLDLVIDEQVREKKEIEDQLVDTIIPEFQIYSSGFPSIKDNDLMKKFHEVETWEQKANFIGKFDQDRFNFLAQKLVYEESPTSLSKDQFNYVHRIISDRLFSEDEYMKDEKNRIMTFKEAEFQLDEEYGRADETGDEKKLNFLKEIDEYIQKMKKIHENA